MENLSIFFDTNVIEAQFSHEKVNLMFHSHIKPNQLFYDVITYIKSVKIEDRTNLYISSISWEEMSLHLKENHKNSTDKLGKYIEAFKKAFGDTLDLSCEFKHVSAEQYNDYLETIKEEFLSANNCNIIDYPRDIECFEQLVDKCVHKQPPFQKAKAGKEYSDAGFKDALILETILRHKRDTGNICLFISTDGDFGNVKDVYLCANIDSFKETITKILGIQNIDMVRTRFNEDYTKAIIIEETGNKYDESVTLYEVIEIKSIADEEDIFDVEIKAIINEAEYHINCQYEISSNNIEVKDYKIENE